MAYTLADYEAAKARVKAAGYSGDDRLDHLHPRMDADGSPFTAIHLGAEAPAGQGVWLR
jgi:hypothetical protein